LLVDALLQRCEAQRSETLAGVVPATLQHL
jgi:hypothetical protein